MYSNTGRLYYVYYVCRFIAYIYKYIYKVITSNHPWRQLCVYSLRGGAFDGASHRSNPRAGDPSASAFVEMAFSMRELPLKVSYGRGKLLSLRVPIA
jgi:hypothetical protein